MSDLTLPGVSLTPDYPQITLKEKQFLRDLKLYYEHKIWSSEQHEFVYHYSIYSMRKGTGNTLSYIFIRSKQRIKKLWQLIAPLTRDDIFSERGGIKIELPEPHIISEIAKEHNIKLDKEDTDAEHWNTILRRHLSHEPFLWKPLEPLTEEEIDIIKRWNFEQLEHDYYYEGLHKSENIVDAFRSEVINFHSNPYAKEETTKKIQPYNSHMSVISPTKMGKTTLGEKIGIYFTEASKSGLTGFSTADTTNIGQLDGTHKLVTCDNVHEYSSESLRGLLEIREKGETIIAKGKAPVHARTTSSIAFILNPPETREPAQLAQFFVEYIRKQAEVSTGPVGSRDSLPLFLTELDEVTGEPLDDITVKKNRLVFEHILDVVNNRVETDIFPHTDIQRWLNRRIDNFYSDIRRFLVNSVVTVEIKSYWLSLGKTSFRHIRGRALKHGIMDNLKSIYLNEYDLTQILNDSEERLHRICNLIIESMQRMLSLISQIPRDEWILNRYQRLPNKNVKAVVLASAIYAKNHQQFVRLYVKTPFMNLAEDYNSLTDDLKPTPYTHHSNIEQNIPSNLTKFNRKIADFGIALTREGPQSMYLVQFIKDPKDLRTLIVKLREETHRNSENRA